MSGNSELSSDEERIFDDDDEYYDDETESSEEEGALSVEDRLFAAVDRDDADAEAVVQEAIRDGANVNAVRDDTTPLLEACKQGSDRIVGILLDAGADARWKDSDGFSVIDMACINGRLSTVQLLINHDIGLLEMADNDGWTSLFRAVGQQHIDIVRFLLDSGADPHCVGRSGVTALMYACQLDNLEIARLLLDAGVDVDARDAWQQTALHDAADCGDIEIVRELILQHNANMFAVNQYGRTPFDLACTLLRNTAVVDHLLEIYSNKLTQDHGQLALHELLKVAEYSFSGEHGFHPPLNPIRIILPLGKLTGKHLHTLLHTLDPELIRSRDDAGKLPIHVACQTDASMEVLALILELDPTSLHIADSTGALPIHLLCGSTATTEYASVRYLVEQGGVGTLAARNRQGLLPLHVLCGSTNPPLQAVQYFIQSFPGSVSTHIRAGQYPFMLAASNSLLGSLSVVYEIVRADPNLVVPR